jgi:hypothetical protein
MSDCIFRSIKTNSNIRSWHAPYVANSKQGTTIEYVVNDINASQYLVLSGWHSQLIRTFTGNFITCKVMVLLLNTEQNSGWVFVFLISQIKTWGPDVASVYK